MRLTKNEKPIFFMMLIMVFLAVSLVTWTVMMTTQSDNSDSLQSDLDNKITQMYNERNRYLSQIQELEISHDVEISRLNSEYEKKTADLQKSAVVQDSSQEIQSLKDEIESLQKRLLDESESSSNNGDDSSSEMTIKSLTSQLITLKEQLKDEKKKNLNTDSDSRITSLKSDLEKMTDNRDELKKTNAKLEAEMTSLENEIKKLEKIIDGLT